MIVFMKNGTIAEVGTHDELVLNDKDYHNLVNMDHAKQSSSDGTRNLQDMDTSNETNDFAADNIIPNGGCDADTKEFIDNKKESQFDVEEIETLSYSSWSVLLEYFKVSIFHRKIICRTDQVNIFDINNKTEIKPKCNFYYN